MAVSPFKQPAAPEQRGRWWDYFRNRDEAFDRRADKVNADANSYAEWAKHPYYAKFLEWLQTMGDDPVKPGAHMDMIVGNTRANTFKEVRKHLLDLEKRAKMVLEED